jgi:hypothetical protein
VGLKGLNSAIQSKFGKRRKAFKKTSNKYI